jgi:Zn-dependent protease with chaperone function
MKIWNERMIQGVNMANKVRLGPDQLPKLYELLPPLCQTLGIDEPEFYLEMNPNPNAYTMGDSVISITVTSGLTEMMDEEMVKAVLAHECGHIACRHVLYSTMAQILLSDGADILGLGVLTLPLQLALFRWQRYAEFSCDRAAAVCMQSPEPMSKAFMYLAGGGNLPYGDINMDAYMQQAIDYEDILFRSNWVKLLQFLALMKQEHPFLSVRARQIEMWCKTEQYQKILQYMNETGNDCPHCGAPLNPDWKFCRRCGKSL